MQTYAQRMKKPQIANLQQSTTATAQISNQAMLGMLNEPDGDTRFSEALRARFAPKPMPQAERSQPMALSPGVLQKAEERYQAPLAGLKAYEDTGLLDSGYNGYAQGNEIHIDGSLAPAKREEVLMHEIGHVVQRGSGRAQGSGLLDNPALEQQAAQGFAAPQSFAMPTSAAGPVMGNRAKSVDTKNQKKELKKAKKIFGKLGLKGKHLSINGLNGRIMRKNAENMSLVAKDFPEAIPKCFLKASMKDEVVMATGYSGAIDVNQERFEKTKPVNVVTDFFGKYKHDIANDNYTGVHEMGHVANARLIDKLRSNKTQRDNDWKHNHTAKAVIIEAISNLASVDTKFNNTVLKAMNVSRINRRGFNFSDPANINNMRKLMTGKKKPLLSKLQKKGYTSKYGASDAGEFFAEAFADRYRIISKANRYKTKPLEKTEYTAKLVKLKKQRNPLSEEVVKIAKLLNNDAMYRATFQAKHGLN